MYVTYKPEIAIAANELGASGIVAIATALVVGYIRFRSGKHKRWVADDIAKISGELFLSPATTRRAIRLAIGLGLLERRKDWSMRPVGAGVVQTGRGQDAQTKPRIKLN